MAERVDALQADIQWHANTGKPAADVVALRRTFRESYAGMSSDALKLASAQDRLDRALVKSKGVITNSVRSAEVAYRQALEQTTTQVRRQDAAVSHNERTLGRFSRGAVAGSGIMGGLGRSVAFASASFLGGAGLLFAIRSTIDAAEEAQVVQAKLGQAVKNSGLDYEQYRKQINDTLQAQSKLSAFDDEELAATFAKLILKTKDVNEALRLNAISADVARGRNISLEAASQLVLKASIGQAGALRRLGIDAAKGASAVELIALIEQKYAGQAGKFAETSAGKQALFNKQLHDSQEIIGGALLPVISDLAGRMAAYLEKLNESGELQRDVNKVVKTGGEVAHDLAAGLGAVKKVVGPVVEGLGGFENAAKLAFAVFAVAKLRGITAGIRGIGTAAAISAGEVNALALAEERAALAGGLPGRAGAAGGVARAAGRGAFVRGAGTVAAAALGAPGLIAIGTLVAYNIASGSDRQLAGGFGEPVAKTKDGRLIYQRDGVLYVRGKGEGATDESVTVRGAGGTPVTVYRFDPAGAAGAARPVTGAERNRRRNSVAVVPDGKRGNRGDGGRTGDGLTKLQRLTLAEQDPGNDLADSRALLAYYTNIVTKGHLEGDKLFQAKQDVIAQRARVQSILDSDAADAAVASEKRAAALAKKHAATKRAADKISAINERASAETARQNTKSRAGLVYDPISGFFEQTKPNVNSAKDKTKGKDGSEPATKADIAGSVREALQQMISIQHRYPPNFQTGKLETHAYEQVHEARRQTDVIERLVGRTSFPASGYALASAEAASS